MRARIVLVACVLALCACRRTYAFDAERPMDASLPDASDVQDGDGSMATPDDGTGTDVPGDVPPHFHDLNGDGYADLVAGSYRSTSVVVYLGGRAGIPAAPSVSLDDPSGATRTGFGWAVAVVGDVNGDGYGDMVIGAPNAATDLGAAYVFPGGPGGPDPGVSQVLMGAGGGEFGKSLAGGDVNRDGYADVVVGAPTAPGGGAVFVFAGSATGMGSTPLAVLHGPSVPDGAAPSFASGVAVDDFDADGFADIAVGSGQGIFVYLGSASGPPSAPSQVVTDAWATGGYDPVVPLGRATGSIHASLAALTLDGAGAPCIDVFQGASTGFAAALLARVPEPASAESWGASFAAGDIDGDGYAELAVGSVGTTGTGRLDVFAGGLGAIATSATWVEEPLDAEATFGTAVAMGDFDHDGYVDIAVGAPLSMTHSGVIATFRGSAAGLRVGPVTVGPIALGELGSSLAAAR